MGGAECYAFKQSAEFSMLLCNRQNPCNAFLLVTMLGKLTKIFINTNFFICVIFRVQHTQGKQRIISVND